MSKFQSLLTDDERAAFEAWWKGDLVDWRGHQNTAALHAWEGWQARATLGAPLPSVVQVPQGYTLDQIADACVAAEIPDSKFESLSIALEGGE